MPQVGFEPVIPVFERAKTVETLDHAATVIGILTDLLLTKPINSVNTLLHRDIN
jgi:hypothetical protein